MIMSHNTAMNQIAFEKREIYQKLSHVNERDLHVISLFIDFLHYKEMPPPGKRKTIKLQGIWKDYEIDVENELAELRKQTWKHLDEEMMNEEICD